MKVGVFLSSKISEQGVFLHSENTDGLPVTHVSGSTGLWSQGRASHAESVPSPLALVTWRQRTLPYIIVMQGREAATQINRRSGDVKTGKQVGKQGRHLNSKLLTTTHLY